MTLANQIATLPADLSVQPASGGYAEDPRGRFESRGGLVVKPKATGDVSTLMAFAHAHAVPVVPYGGGTGLVGGANCPFCAGPYRP